MNRSQIIILILLALVVTMPIILFQSSENSESPARACIKEVCFNVEIAETPEEMSKGLMNRPSLKEDSGMLFAFEGESINSFWMKNTLIPLDIIWIGKDMRIKSISKNTSTCLADPCPVYNSGVLSAYVLEINANLSEKYGFNEGDIVKFAG